MQTFAHFFFRFDFPSSSPLYLQQPSFGDLEPLSDTWKGISA